VSRNSFTNEAVIAMIYLLEIYKIRAIMPVQGINL